MRKTRQLALAISVKPHLRDHRFEEKAVLPAVEIMRLLADAVANSYPEAQVNQITRARFSRFLMLPTESRPIEAAAVISTGKHNDIHASLVTQLSSRKTTIKRTLRHAELCFSSDIAAAPLPLDVASSLEGPCADIDACRVYPDLISFGPAFQNLRNRLYLSQDGVLARVAGSSREGVAPASGTSVDSPLGAVFPLDAALQAACVWGQRFAEVVAFPVGIEKRILWEPTVSGETYLARVVPHLTEPQVLYFDIWIYDEAARLREAALGVQMQDVSRGRLRPPAWIVASKPGRGLNRLEENCAALSLMERTAVIPMAEEALSPAEKQRMAEMGGRRKGSYLAARMVCKRLYRTLAGDNLQTPAGAINTIETDMQRPCCPTTGDGRPYACSVSHDNRFVVAAASRQPLGLDVEMVSDRVLKSGDLFMGPGELALLKRSGLDLPQAATRVWSIKEAVAKAMGIALADAWQRARVLEINEYRSSVQIDRGTVHKVWHDCIGEHVFTLVKLDTPAKRTLGPKSSP